MQFARLSIYVLSIVCLLLFSAVGKADELARLKYNNPGLVVDLGVGLWAWPVPCDADGDGDFDLIVSCPDKPFNGIWLFENPTGDTAKQKFPVFKPPQRLSRTVHYVLPSYVGDELRVLSPSTEYRDFVRRGLDEPANLPAPKTIHVPRGNAPGARANKIRHNQWRYADYDGDGALDLIVGIEDWGDYGWDDAWDAGGPLEERAAARLRLLAAQHRHDAPARGTPIRGWSRPRASRWIPTAAPRRTSPTSTATATSICCAANSSISSPTSKTPARARRRATPPAGD